MAGSLEIFDHVVGVPDHEYDLEIGKSFPSFANDVGSAQVALEYDVAYEQVDRGTVLQYGKSRRAIPCLSDGVTELGKL